MRILLVEDEVRLADAIGQILKSQKYIVDTFYDGETGLDYGLSGIYDLIILDIMLPKLNGF
ncbi:MAG: response regulator, partial [Turicibacter sp.]|nr:response regulator [Turicibacter sp.]